MERSKLVKLVKIEMLKRDLQQVDLAAMAGVSQPMISALLSGNETTTPEVAAKISQATGVNLRDCILAFCPKYPALAAAIAGQSAE